MTCSNVKFVQFKLKKSRTPGQNNVFRLSQVVDNNFLDLVQTEITQINDVLILNVTTVLTER